MKRAFIHRETKAKPSNCWRKNLAISIATVSNRNTINNSDFIYVSSLPKIKNEKRKEKGMGTLHAIIVVVEVRYFPSCYKL